MTQPALPTEIRLCFSSAFRVHPDGRLQSQDFGTTFGIRGRLSAQTELSVRGMTAVLISLRWLARRVWKAALGVARVAVYLLVLGIRLLNLLLMTILEFRIGALLR